MNIAPARGRILAHSWVKLTSRLVRGQMRERSKRLSLLIAMSMGAASASAWAVESLQFPGAASAAKAAAAAPPAAGQKPGTQETVEAGAKSAAPASPSPMSRPRQLAARRPTIPARSQLALSQAALQTTGGQGTGYDPRQEAVRRAQGPGTDESPRHRRILTRLPCRRHCTSR